MTSNKEEKINIRCFNLENVLTDSVVFCIGRRRSGKSWLMRELMYVMRNKMNYGKIYSGTEHCSSGFFCKFFPKLYIHSEFTDQDFAEILHQQRTKIKKVAKKYNVDNGKVKENNMLLIVDDLMNDDLIWKKSKNFRDVFTAGRHYNLMMIMSLQYVLGISPGLRENIDYVFLFACDGNNLKKIYENYAGCIPTFKMFKTIFYNCTRDHSCMVIDKTSTSDKLTDKVFFYKAKDPGRFRFGSAAFWKIHDENYQSSDEDEDDENVVSNLKKLVNIYGDNNQKYEISFG
jgi:hypothetical protein